MWSIHIHQNHMRNDEILHFCSPHEKSSQKFYEVFPLNRLSRQFSLFLVLRGRFSNKMHDIDEVRCEQKWEMKRAMCPVEVEILLTTAIRNKWNGKIMQSRKINQKNDCVLFGSTAIEANTWRTSPYSGSVRTQRINNRFRWPEKRFETKKCRIRIQNEII